MPSKSFLKAMALLLIFTSAPATIYILYSRTGGPESQKELSFHRNIRFALMGGTDTVDIKPLTEWPWVKACALKDNLSREQVNAVIGREYPHYRELNWMGQEDYWTLVFEDSERDTSWGLHTPSVPVRMPKKDIAGAVFPDGVDGICFTEDQSVLAVTRSAAPVGQSPAVLQLGPSDPAS